MTDKTIHDLTSISGFASPADELIIWDVTDSATRKVTVQNLMDIVVDASTVAEAGAIMDSDFTGMTGFMKVESSGVYSASAAIPQSAVTNLVIDLAAHTSSITVLDALTSGHTVELAAVSATLSSHATSITSLNALTSVHTVELATVSSNIADLQALTSSHTVELASVSATLSAHSTSIATLTNSVSVINVELASISSNIVAVSNAVSALTSVVSLKQPLDSTLTALAGVSTAADRLIYGTGVDTFDVTPFSSYARSLVAEDTNTSARVNLGLGSIATQNSDAISLTGGSINGVVIGNTAATSATFTDVSCSSIHCTTPVSIVHGGTGSSTAAGAKANLLVYNMDVTTYTSSYELRLIDLGKRLRFNTTTTCAITIPTNASVAFSVGDILYLTQVSTGQVTVSGAAGVTVNYPGSTAKTKLNSKGSSCAIHLISADTWDVVGDMTT